MERPALTKDTICAVATPAGVGGIAVLRLSGDKAVAIALHFMPALSRLEERRATYTTFVLPEGLLDEVVVTYFCAPRSYTGESVVEISCHGSLYVQQRMLQALLTQGARLAQPGEFTQRAFLNGRLDLSQAEAVADLIDSTNSASHRLAVGQLRGGYSEELKTLRDKFVELASLMELELDFSDEDVEFADRTQLQNLVETLANKVSVLCNSFRLGNAIKTGVPVAIIGSPNVGKSTLLNALLQEERAIVSDIPGTTRDTIEDTLNLDGIAFRFVDTAGLRQSDDQIETVGIQRSYRAAEQAQIILYVAEADQKVSDLQDSLSALAEQVPLQSKHLFVLRNKIDSCAAAVETPMLPYPQLLISAKQGQGLDTLRKTLVEMVRHELPQSDVLVTNVRHYEALQQVRDALARVRQGLEMSLTADLVLIDIREALYDLGQITGQVTTTDLLTTIFSRFCIGK